MPKTKDIITIKVSSGIMEVTRHFTNDRKSITWLKRVDRIHMMQREIMAGTKPMKKFFAKNKLEWKKAYERWFASVGNHLPLKIEITHSN